MNKLIPTGYTAPAQALQDGLSDLDLEVRRLAKRFGASAVKESVARLCKSKRGRRPERDWPLLFPYFEEDAKIWIAGGGPNDMRSNYAIAQEIAQNHPGHSETATHRRIMNKLGDRKYWALLIALTQPESECRWRNRVRILDNIRRTGRFDSASEMLFNVELSLEEYKSHFGKPPPDELTLPQIREECLSIRPKNMLGAGGLLGVYTP